MPAEMIEMTNTITENSTAIPTAGAIYDFVMNLLQSQS